jgi:hypothetical protein
MAFSEEQRYTLRQTVDEFYEKFWDMDYPAVLKQIRDARTNKLKQDLKSK